MVKKTHLRNAVVSLIASVSIAIVIALAYTPETSVELINVSSSDGDEIINEILHKDRIGFQFNSLYLRFNKNDIISRIRLKSEEFGSLPKPGITVRVWLHGDPKSIARRYVCFKDSGKWKILDLDVKYTYD